METIKTYDSFNFRRYSNPWVAKVSRSGKVDFSERIGGYTGGYNKGEAGELYVNEPQEGQVYAFGQKDYRGNNGGYEYTVFQDGKFDFIAKIDLTKYLK